MAPNGSHPNDAITDAMFIVYRQINLIIQVFIIYYMCVYSLYLIAIRAERSGRCIVTGLARLQIRIRVADDRDCDGLLLLTTRSSSNNSYNY